ncbi:MAG: hypothetical protein Q8Q08_11025 [Candidatus Omnitrophota bacterium]|nr:hypothetical protein [Candidatus Omnitrophota bacterium]MDZ4243115.1 hypothetical protein [Candidatus Omnitrophota bacterium]
MNIWTKKSFTIMEIMVVIVIIGAVAGFAIPNYVKTVERAHEQDATTQLSAIHSANNIYRANNGRYWPLDTGTYPLNGATSINTSLGLSVIANGMTYTCTGSAGGATYQCNAVRNAPAASFTVRVDQNPLGSTNPDCVLGQCP